MNKKNLVIFYFARMTGLAFKPVLIWLLIKHNAEIANEVARYFFVSASTFVFYNTGIHVAYYKIIFGENYGRIKINKATYKYVQEFIIHLTIMSIPLLIFLEAATKDLHTSLIFLLVAIMEKIWDEIQRYQIFSEKFRAWAVLFLAKVFLIIIAVSIAYYTNSNFLTAIALLSFLYYCLVTRYVAIKYLKIKIAKFVKMISLLRVKNAILSYGKQGIGNQLISISSANILLIDKWLLEKSIYSNKLAQVVMLGQIGSIFLIMVDNIYMTQNRKKYIKQNIGMDQILNINILILNSLLFSIFSLLFLSIFKKYAGISDLSSLQIILILLLYVLNGVSKPYYERVYWGGSIIKLAIFETTFIFLMGIFGYFFMSAYGFDGLYISMFLLMTVRTVLLSILIKISK